MPKRDSKYPYQVLAALNAMYAQNNGAPVPRSVLAEACADFLPVNYESRRKTYWRALRHLIAEGRIEHVSGGLVPRVLAQVQLPGSAIPIYVRQKHLGAVLAALAKAKEVP